MKTIDNQYLNVVINANPADYPNASPAVYNQSLTLPLLQNASEYYCSCIRFSIPSDTIPITIFPLDKNQPDPAVSYLVVGIKYSGTLYPQSVFYVPQPNNLPLPTTTEVAPPYYTDSQAISQCYWIYSINALLNMFNNALNQAMILAGFPLTMTFTVTAANATINAVYEDIYGNQFSVNSTIVGATTLVTTSLFGGNIVPSGNTLTKIMGTGDATITFSAAVASGVSRPFYSWTPQSQLFSLTAATDFLATGMEIFLNGDAKEYLSFFNFYFNNTVTVDGYLFYHVLSPLPSGSSPYVFYQDAPSLPLWFDLKKIVITTNLPILTESTPTQNPYNLGSQNGLTAQQPILTDFIVSFENSSDIGSVVVYSPTSQYRLIDMGTNQPIQNLFFQFFWQDSLGNLIPMTINPNQTASLKIAFLKKDLYKGSKLALKL
jgi:hypothetical protein